MLLPKKKKKKTREKKSEQTRNKTKKTITEKLAIKEFYTIVQYTPEFSSFLETLKLIFCSYLFFLWFC